MEAHNYPAPLTAKNAGTVGQTRQTDAYRLVSSGASEKIFVLAFDYRGFGSSTGSPTEDGLITDAISVIKWAMEVANVSPNRIVLVAQSLGTGLASAAAAHFVNSQPKIEFAGIVLCATFTESSSVFMDFRLKGLIAPLAPLRYFPTLEAWFKRSIKDTWKTSDRLMTLVKKSDRLRLTLVHATSDQVISWRNCNDLFYTTVNAADERKLTNAEIDEGKETRHLGDGGWTCCWVAGDKVIRQNVLKHGGKSYVPLLIETAHRLHRA